LNDAAKRSRAGVCLRACMSFPTAPRTHSLSPHPATPPGPVRELQASVRREGDTLLLQYRLEGDLDSILLPQMPPKRADNLWKHSCFEAFLGGAGLSAYREYNFSPSGAWAIYDFDGYRSGMRADQWVVIPGIMTRREAGALILDATVDVRWMPTAMLAGPRLGVTAVIEDKAGGLSYWALKHPSEKPDFHHADGFIDV
jgi:hypothetical protein